MSKEYLRCPHCSKVSKEIRKRILHDYQLRYRDDKRNYWGITADIPARIEILVDEVLKEMGIDATAVDGQYTRKKSEDENAES